MKRFIYKIIDLLTLGRGIKVRISGFGLRLPTRYYKYFEPEYELNNINFINNHLTQGMTAIDVGAHIGLLSVIIAKKVSPGGKVFSFEPTPSSFTLLKKTFRINNAEAVAIPVNKAVSEKSGKETFYVMDTEASNSNSLSNNKRDFGNETKMDVEVVSIDDFSKENKIDKIDLIKIDAEGTEYSVLKGATNVIDACKPNIILALHPNSINNFGDSLLAIWEFILLKGYRVIYKNREMTKDDFIKQTDLFDVFLI